MDTIESGLELFVTDALSKSEDEESFGNFVITTSDGTRFFAYFKGFKDKIFVCTSRFPLLSFSRNLLELISFENSNLIESIFLCLCETPIYPAYRLTYQIQLTNGTANIDFSNIEQVDDTDSNFIVLSLFTPLILVTAWEAIILERKVLVVCSVSSVLGACCEFLRRISLPLVTVNTFVPVLPKQLINAVSYYSFFNSFY